MLVIPAIEIRKQRCLRDIGDTSGEDLYPHDPEGMAFLWRKENAKTLHITDYCGLYDGLTSNHDCILDAVGRIEIPVQLLTKFADKTECSRWLDEGVYRIIIHDLIMLDPDSVSALIEEYGPSRICAGAITSEGKVIGNWRDVKAVDTVEYANRAAQLGINRLFFTDRKYEGELHGPNYQELHRLAMETPLHITAAGGVANVQHLWKLQEMEAEGIDSVVIGRAFYENKFPCQQLWRDIEVDRLHNRSRWEQSVSTSTLHDHSSND